MIRLTAPLGRYILTALRFLALSPEAKTFHSSEPSIHSLRWHADKKISNAQYESLSDRESGQFPPQIGLDVAIERLEEYLRSRNGATDVIESLAEVLKGTLGRSIISGETLKMLQSAILRGDEFIELNKNLKSGVLHCNQCAHPFESQAMEAALIYRDTTGTKILCSTCAYPRVVACNSQGCKSVVAVSREFQTNWVAAVQSSDSNCGGKHRPAKEKPLLEEENGRYARRPPLEVAEAPNVAAPPPNINPFRVAATRRGAQNVAFGAAAGENLARWAQMPNEGHPRGRGLNPPVAPPIAEIDLAPLPEDLF